jgi:eukaryotic-like serine/threonine-protein kinase
MQGQRELNEDAYACVNPAVTNVQLIKGACAMIADGTGGDGTGRDASHYCQSRLFEEYYSTPDSWSVERSVIESMNNINRWLFGRRNATKSYLCTLSLIVLRGRSYHIFHVGDTRIYLWRSAKLIKLTQDHHYPGQSNRLVRAMGLDSIVKPDTTQGNIEIGDVFIMTSDGVHACCEDEDITAILKQNYPSQRIAAELGQIGLNKGHGDNSTVQVIQITELPLPNRSEMIAEESYLTASPELNPNDRIDGYIIKKRMGGGGMATIYQAEEIETGRELAIKCPKPELMKQPVQLERFHREEWTGLRLHSPYLMRMYPPTPRRSQYYYIVMEICRGKSLRRRLEEQKQFSTDYIQNIAYQMAKGLNFMHNLNIIHRDIKPENIMVSDEGAVKIVDYGIVRLPGLSQLNTDDEVRNLIGSPYYMAPEFFNQNARGSVQTDIYAMGVVLYELLSGGQFPYGKVDDLDYFGEAPAYRSLMKLRNDLPDWMDQLIHKCVHWDSSERLGALSEFLFCLDHPGEITVVENNSPLAMRRPLTFWKWLAFSQLAIILFLLYQLIASS